MATISNFLKPSYSLICGRDWSNNGEPLEYETAKEKARIVVIEIFKVGAAIASYLAVTFIMSTAATPLTAYALGILILGAAYFITAKVSRFFHDAIKITIGVFLIKKLCIDQAIIPFIQTVKTAYQSWSVIESSSFTIPSDLTPAATTALKIFGIGFLRFFFGIGCGGVGGPWMILDDHRKNPLLSQQDDIGNIRNYDPARPLEPKRIDMVILTAAGFIGGCIARIRGYREQNSP